MKPYIPRIVDEELQSLREVMGAILIEGPKACGKTMTASQVAKTRFDIDDDGVFSDLLSLNPDHIFKSERPILFDEWQIEPGLWNRIRRQIDREGSHGDFILTGSSTPNDDITRHSGAGRFAELKMRPMSLYESSHSSGEVSLAKLLSGDEQRASGDQLSFQQLLERIIIGGWPQLIDQPEQAARRWLRSYLRQISEVDMPLMGVRRSPLTIQRLFAALARNVGQSVSIGQLARDVAGADNESLHSETVAQYLNILRRLHITENSLAWRPHMRSRTRLREGETRYFIDPSLATAALDVGTNDLAKDPRATGFLFESLVVRDLRIYSQALDGEVSSWRDQNGNEVDAIIELRNGTWGAFEIKLNPKDVDAGAESLKRFAEKIDTSKHGEPAALGVITSKGAGGQRSDGVHIIPISTLGP